MSEQATMRQSDKMAFFQEVPADWPMLKIGTISSKVGSGKTPSGGAENYQNEGVLFLRSQNVHDSGLRLEDAVFITADIDDEMSQTRVLEGDILLNITGASIGRTAVVPRPFVAANVNQHVCIIRLLKDAASAFVGYAMQTPELKAQIFSDLTGAARDGLNFEQVKALRIPLPPLLEQQAIAAFLDRETGKIDALVEEQRRLIALLKEKRQAVISRAVTKGLDPTASLKPSGIDWLGDIPAHWEVAPLKRGIASITQGWSPQCDSRPAEDGELGVLKVGCVNGGIFRREENKALPNELEPRDGLELRSGDLLISRANTRDLVGSAAVVPDDEPSLLLCDKLYRLRLMPERLNPDFVALQLGTSIGREVIELSATGASASMLNIGQATITELPLPVPPIAEQTRLVEHVMKEARRFDALTAEATRAIDLLQERRAALISAAVTGKIDVRDESRNTTQEDAA